MKGDQQYYKNSDSEFNFQHLKPKESLVSVINACMTTYVDVISSLFFPYS
jgi:hypothetical protein